MQCVGQTLPAVLLGSVLLHGQAGGSVAGEVVQVERGQQGGPGLGPAGGLHHALAVPAVLAAGVARVADQVGIAAHALQHNGEQCSKRREQYGLPCSLEPGRAGPGCSGAASAGPTG